MDRHPFDPIALVFGLVFLAAGIIVASGGSLLDDGRFLLPVGLIGLGIAVMLRIRIGRPEDPEPVTADPAETVDPVETVDDLDV